MGNNLLKNPRNREQLEQLSKEELITIVLETQKQEEHRLNMVAGLIIDHENLRLSHLKLKSLYGHE